LDKTAQATREEFGVMTFSIVRQKPAAVLVPPTRVVQGSTLGRFQLFAKRSTRACSGFLAAIAIGLVAPGHAQEARLDALEQRIAEQDKRIRELEAIVARQAGLLDRAPPPAPAAPIAIGAGDPLPGQAAAWTPTRTNAGVPPGRSVQIVGLDVGGDVRVRQEWNRAAGRDRARSAVRARLRATYSLNDHLAMGTQVVTGDPDDPNSTDVTLGNFIDDFPLALDQAWIRYERGGLTAVAGKFPQPLQRTDMLWDGDVSPQGVAAAYETTFGKARIDARGIWFIIDEAATARDSDMLGGQIALSAPLTNALKAGLAGSYYHYRLGSVTGGDAGDFRGNLISGGRYLSDFHLVEAIGTLGWTGPSARWPVKFTADYVHNAGAAVAGDTAFNLELAAGRAATRGDWRLAYNYSEVEVDAVLAAFSHDNIDLSTNYKLHGVGIGYVPADHLQLDLLWYHYRPLDAAYAGALSPDRWLDRVRLAFMVSF
jgi:hypothetical protein